MKKLLLVIASIVAFLAVSIPGVRIQHDPLSKKERFALELQRCQQAAAGKGGPGKCQLYGKIQFVDSFPDVKVKAVSSFPDIKVKIVDSFADRPGEWKVVDSFPDYKVQFVNSFPDYKIKFVDSFPGCD